MFIGLGGLQNHGQVQSVGDNKVHYLNRPVVQNMPKVIVTLGDAKTLGQVFSPGLVDIRNGNDFNGNPLHLPVGAQMESGSEACSRNSDFNRLIHRQSILYQIDRFKKSFGLDSPVSTTTGENPFQFFHPPFLSSKLRHEPVGGDFWPIQ
jgi:hypothetical protein